MLEARIVIYTQVPHNIECILGVDVGGTNSNFGFFSREQEKLILHASLHYKTQEIINFADNFIDSLLYMYQTYGVTVDRACIAAAGLEHDEWIKPTNAHFKVDIVEIKKKIQEKYALGLLGQLLDHINLANDFEVIHHGLSHIDPQDIVQIKQGYIHEESVRVIIGAGTGLGKSILVWDSKNKNYKSLPSEGGHADFAPQTQQEFDLVRFIQNEHRANRVSFLEKNASCVVSWEDVLSGNGIDYIYRFFEFYNDNLNDDVYVPHKKNIILHPDEIFESRNRSPRCYDTFELYAHLYARCAKNFALETVARGGVYIAGGIAAKNIGLFKRKSFIADFINCGKQQELLESIPVFVITDYNVSLYGAAVYALK